MSETKHLTRDAQNKKIAGVCAGFGNYLGADPTVIRLIFALCVIFGGSGLLIYLICWLVMPEA